ncbi:hypothetical protein Tco_0576759 [Tanacetum coccineum]
MTMRISSYKLYDSDYDDKVTTNAIFMANLSLVDSINDDMVDPRYDSDILFEVPHYDNYHDFDMLNSNIQELGYIENIVSNNKSYDELTSNINVISYTDYMLTIGNDDDNYVPPPLQKNDMMLSVIEQIKSQVEKYLLSKFDEWKRRTTLSPNKIGSWEQSDIKGALKKDVIPFSENQKETFKLFEKGFIAEVKEIKDIFEQMKDEVDQRVSFTNASGSKPRSNTKNDRIQRTSSKNKKNKVEAHHRKFKSSANKNNHVSNCNANVKNVALLKNFDSISLSCNEYLFPVNHDACVVKYLKKMQKRKVAKSTKQKVKSKWKPTGKVFTLVGLRWKPTGMMFTMEGKIIQTFPATIVSPRNRVHTIRNPAGAPKAETRMRYSIAKNSLIRAHINSYDHLFNHPKSAFVRNSMISA